MTMHRPSRPRNYHATNLMAIAAGLAAAASVKVRGAILPFDLDKAMHSARNRIKRYYSAGHPYPRQSEREKIRRRLGGFHRLHDHSVHVTSKNERVRRCPVCDLRLTHKEIMRDVPNLLGLER